MDSKKLDSKKYLNELQKIKEKYIYEKHYPQKWEQDPEEDMRTQKELQDMIEKFYRMNKEEQRRKNVCLLCGEEVPMHPMVCQDCKRVFAAFKSILVEEKELPKAE